MGETPLPKEMINRPVEEDDVDRFQSIFAEEEGAVTAPSAGLHFSRELMKRMEIKGMSHYMQVLVTLEKSMLRI